MLRPSALLALAEEFHRANARSCQSSVVPSKVKVARINWGLVNRCPMSGCTLTGMASDMESRREVKCTHG